MLQDTKGKRQRLLLRSYVSRSAVNFPEALVSPPLEGSTSASSCLNRSRREPTYPDTLFSRTSSVSFGRPSMGVRTSSSLKFFPNSPVLCSSQRLEKVSVPA